ncbi:MULTISPECIES: hypothetical protein [unclassified Methanoregula]|uniref:hypothetical protein n=1 Tax=unclassified Methanoregula TaxID=2649730 RepID=UPI0009CC74A2|nr:MULTISPECIES: hypothetical protein [unclassified Methanoregula]OPX64288.1 MAG: hypothetical protein A4E33_01317 [Methanoregula sp. PtaB.Bin085]OPY33587.1 MAG: hypothetical protein A4E34_01910 [Methanoregula sp. PtaU1.Bin006]
MSPTVRKDCACPKVTCRRHTLCDECEAEQARKGNLPFCKRPRKVSLRDRIRELLGLGK